jgi:hypothetical protein
VPQITKREFERLPLRVHAFLADVSLHDAWVIDLPRIRGGISLDAFLRATGGHVFTPSPVVRGLLKLRFEVGRVAGWDRPPSSQARMRESFSDRLTAEDRKRSLEPAGKRAGAFRVVYQFENEQLTELINATAHAGALSALVETPASYRFYFGVYVRPTGPLTPLYMALIDPFRKLVVYPSLLRSVRAHWERTMTADSSGVG